MADDSKTHFEGRVLKESVLLVPVAFWNINCPPALFGPAEKMSAESEALQRLSAPSSSYAAGDNV